MGLRGKRPSLISGTHGAPKLITTGAKRTCKCCKGEIAKGENCFVVRVPGKQGYRNYCYKCMAEVIKQSRADLDKIEKLLEKKEDVSENARLCYVKK